MERKPQRGNLSRDPDGVRVVFREPTGRRVAVLLAVVGSGVLAAFLLLRADSPGESVAVVNEPAGIPVPAVGPEAVHTERHRVLPPRGNVVRSRPKADVARTSTELERSGDVDEKARPEMEARDFIAALRESGETAGLAAFSPPGTRPPRSGVIVPADYELPEGFARHYQTTDDGRRLAPVLVVAPGYEIVDEAGDPVALTDDRIVPPEYAPPDLPVQMLDVPSERDPGENIH